MAEGSDFALELVVGIKDMFTKEAKKIDAEVNKLEKDTTELQKTFDDTSAYVKATRALEDMARAGDTTAEQIRQQEKVVDDLARNLKKAGVDINNITREEKRLAQQMKETNDQLKKRSGFKDLITGGLTAVASHSMLKAFINAGNDIERIRMMLRQQSNLSEAEISGQQARDFRTRMTQLYGAHTAETAGTQAWFNRQNQLSGGQNLAATSAALKLGKLMEGQVGQEEINKAMTQLLAGGVSPDKAASLMYHTFKNGRGNPAELMDVVQEYFTNLHSRGLSAEQFFAALEIGSTKGGVFNYDKIADSLKETFNARLSDQGMMATFLGGGKRKGVIDELKDGGLKYDLHNAIMKYQADLAAGKNTVGDVANIYKQLSRVGKEDPAAMRDISEYIGGTMLAEDTSKDTAGAIGQALANPNAVIDRHSQEFDNQQKLLSPVDQALANKIAATESASNATADATKHLGFFSDALTSATTALTSLSSSHPGTSETLSAISMGLMSLGGIGGGVKALRGAGRLLGLGRLGAGFANLGRGAMLGSELMLSSVGARGLLSGTVNGIGKGASFIGRGLSFGKGLLGKGMRLGSRFSGPLQAIPDLYEAWGDYKKGDNRGASDKVGGAAGAIAGGELGAAMGSVVPGFGTVVGGLVGSVAGYYGGSALTDKLYDWWNSDDDKKQDASQQRLQTQVDNLPSSDDLNVSTGGGYVPNVQLNFTPQIGIQAMTANPEDISKALMDAFRQATPELMQQIQDTLADIMLANDHQRPSN